MAELELVVDGMSCAHCEHAVSAGLATLSGVVEVRADAASGRVTVAHDAPLSRARVEQAINDAGYELRTWPVDLDE